jgi:hypothetical protein
MDARKTPAKKAVMKKAAIGKTVMKKAVMKKAAATQKAGARSAGGAAEGYFARQTPEKRALLDELSALVMKTVPDVDTTIKWGVPFYEKHGQKVCALAAFKDYVAINFFAPPDAFVDPAGKLEGAGKGNRALKVRTAKDLDRASITRWLKATVARLG